MRFKQALPVMGILSIVPGLYFIFPKKMETDSVGDFKTWAPLPGEIAQKVGSVTGGHYQDERHLQFTRMFQQRYRDHELAIGLKFLDNNTLKAMFAPIIPRWDMARVAVQAESEAHALFGRNVRVDIFETYISAPMRKLGEVNRQAPGEPVQVRFSPRFAVQQMNQRRSRQPVGRPEISNETLTPFPHPAIFNGRVKP